MTTTYRDKKTGKELDINIAGNTYLSRITVGLWRKLGFAPRSYEDCQIACRILKNHLIYQTYEDFILMEFGIEKLKDDEITFFKEEVLPFFENAKEGIEYPDIEEVSIKNDWKTLLGKRFKRI